MSKADTFYQRIAMGGPAIVAVIRVPGLEVSFVNNQFEEHFGFSDTEAEEQGLHFTEIIEPYQVDRLLYQLAHVRDFKEAQSKYVIYRLKRKDGIIAQYYLYAAPLSDGSNDSYHLVLFPDLSKWNTPFTSFTTRELFLEHFMTDNFGTFEWIIDEDKVFWSDGIYRIYEIDTQMELNRKFTEQFTHPNDKEKVSIAVKKAIETGIDLSIDYKIITAKKNTRIIHCLARTVNNIEGKPIKFAGSIRDITGQRSIEDDLKHKVRQLYHSNKDLEEFAYVASHDMQEPLRKITTFSDRLSEKYKDTLEGDGAMYLSRIIASAGNMRSLINDLLDFSRISKTGQPFETVDLNNILRQVTTDLELTIEETRTALNASVLPAIEAVPSQMKQLFSNIISNAIKFHKPDIAPVIRIEHELLSYNEKLHSDLLPDTEYHKITITDNGIGFEPEFASRIFQVFQRLHGKSEYPGSGIGLAICKKIVEYHHGTIYAEDLSGNGARFVFILPTLQNTKDGNL